MPSSAHESLARSLSRTDPRPSTESAARQNLLQLIQLRWIAVAGQVITIGYVTFDYGIRLPLLPMALVIAGLVVLNLVSYYRPRLDGEVRNGDLLLALVLDVAALTALLYCSGGATNPFVFLYLLQVTVGAIMLEARSTWVLVLLTSLCFVGLTRYAVPLALPADSPYSLFELHILGMVICFVLDVGLVVVFVSRISAILRRRDERLAALRQRAAEEDHIVRMGLLASGAAHELGTPLATLAVILNDWRHLPQLRDDPDLRQELGDMQAAVQRCKSIVTGILLSAGEARGEAPAVTTLGAFFDELIEEWRSNCNVRHFEYDDDPDTGMQDELPIVADPALKQVIFNVLDNARDVSPDWIAVEVGCHFGLLTIRVYDRGPGFPPWMIAQIGKPYQSTKGRPGGGLGLFLVVNVIRQFGGSVTAENRIGGGAVVSVSLPLAALAIGERDGA